ncbi:hypothetical protein SRO_0992 [Streptomyces rochei]|nr:hypothetical protein SRO_0992 [Streptomyces rochei]
MGDRPVLNRVLAGLGTTVFAEMSALAAATGAINPGQGFPDTDGPAAVAEAAVRAIREGRGNQYPPSVGIPELRTAAAEHQRRFYKPAYDPDTEVVVTAGATEALAAALPALLEPGDEVITLDPAYDSYSACPAKAGAVRVPVVPRPPAFRPDLDALRDAVTPRTRLLVLNSPHNPTGTVLTDEELRAIAGLAVERDLLVASDEVYEHLVYDRVRHRPIAGLPGRRERTVTISSAGKSFSFTGWKAGWATGSPELLASVRTTKQYLTLPGPAPSRTPRPRRCGCPMRTSPGSARTSNSAVTCSPPDSRRPGSTSCGPQAPASSASTSARWARETGWPFAGRCPPAAASSASRTPSSTPTRTPAAPWSGSPSASRPAYWRKRCAGSRTCPPARQDLPPTRPFPSPAPRD